MSWSVLLVPEHREEKESSVGRPAAGNGLRLLPDQQFGGASAGRRFLEHAVARTEGDVAAVRRPDREASQRSIERESLADAAERSATQRSPADSPETVAVGGVLGIGREHQLLVRAGVTDGAKRFAGTIEPRELLRRGLAPGAVREPAVLDAEKAG